MITEKLMNLFEGTASNYIPISKKNFKSVKILTHKDLDGMISGILMVNQLEKQGIERNRMVIEFGQYGDSNLDLLNSSTPSNKTQATAVSDFAALPRVGLAADIKKLTGFKAKPYAIANFVNKLDWTKVSYSEFVSDISKSLPVEKNKFTEGTLKEIYPALKAYCESYKSKNRMTSGNAESYEKINISNPDFVTDHHNNDQGRLYGGKSGQIAVSSKSNAEELNRRYCDNIMSKDDIEAVSMIDSAGYSKDELENTVFLKKNFHGESKKRNLATITNTLAEQLIKINPEAAKWVIKNSQPSLVSVYSNIIRAMKLNGAEASYLGAMKDGNVEKAKKIASELPESFLKMFTRKSYKEDIKLRPLMSTDEWKKKNEDDMKIAQTGHMSEKEKQQIDALKAEKKSLGRKKEAKERKEEIDSEISSLNSKQGRVFFYKDFAVMDNSILKGYPSRYQPSLVSDSNGERKAYTIKMFPDFVQAAANPLYKGNVDFPKVWAAVAPEYKRWLASKGFNEFKIKSIMDDTNEQSGGHKGIFSIKAFDKIKPSNSEGYGEYWDLRDKISRAEKVGKKPEEFIPNTFKRYSELENGAIAKYKEMKKEAVKFIISAFIAKTEEMYPVDNTKFTDSKVSNDLFKIKN